VNPVTQALQAVPRVAFEPAGSFRAAGNEDG
jgi:hypothetical protein